MGEREKVISGRYEEKKYYSGDMSVSIYLCQSGRRRAVSLLWLACKLSE